MIWKCTKCGVFQDTPVTLIASADPNAKLGVKKCKFCHSDVEKSTVISKELRTEKQ